MDQKAPRRLALTLRWKIHLVVLLLVTVGCIAYGTAGGGGSLFFYIPVAWALVLAATALGDWYFDRREGWAESTGVGWAGNMNPFGGDE